MQASGRRAARTLGRAGNALRERDHGGGDHPVPSRTRQLSPPSPRVLRGQPAGGQDVALAQGVCCVVGPFGALLALWGLFGVRGCTAGFSHSRHSLRFGAFSRRKTPRIPQPFKLTRFSITRSCSHLQACIEDEQSQMCCALSCAGSLSCRFSCAPAYWASGKVLQTNTLIFPCNQMRPSTNSSMSFLAHAAKGFATLSSKGVPAGHLVRPAVHLARL